MLFSDLTFKDSLKVTSGVTSEIKWYTLKPFMDKL